jgi:adenine deaminase
MQAIQAATLWSMRAWRKDREAGSVEAGKRADLVVLNRNPLDDISAIRDIHMVIKSGQVVDREALSKWKNPFPQPDDQNERRIPLVDEVSPFGLPVSKNGAKVAEVIIKGGNFTPECRVVFNDQFVPTKFYDSNRLGITIAPSQLKEPGTYPLSVIQPGSGGGVSNLWYFYVTF